MNRKSLSNITKNKTYKIQNIRKVIKKMRRQKISDKRKKKIQRRVIKMKKIRRNRRMIWFLWQSKSSKYFKKNYLCWEKKSRLEISSFKLKKRSKRLWLRKNKLMTRNNKLRSEIISFFSPKYNSHQAWMEKMSKPRNE